MTSRVIIARYLRVLQLAALIGMTAGCSDAQGLQSLAGSVEFKGKLLEKGRIQFETANESGKPYFTGAMIQRGEYVVPSKFGLPPGSYRVTINAASEAFYVPDPLGSDTKVLSTKELIPADYNTESEQMVEVQAGVDNVFNFTIQ